MTSSEISDQRSPDSTKIGHWLFRRRSIIPVPFALALLLIRAGEAPSSWTLVGSGVILTVAGELIRLWAVRHIGVISRTRSERLGPLVSSGPFGFVRNPLYVGNILLWVGFALTARLLWAAPLVAVLLAAEYHAIVRWEETLLLGRMGDAYRDYMRRVPRWVPAGRSADRPRREEADASFDRPRYSWRETLFSERGTLLAIAAGWALLWVKSAV